MMPRLGPGCDPHGATREPAIEIRTRIPYTQEVIVDCPRPSLAPRAAPRVALLFAVGLPLAALSLAALSGCSTMTHKHIAPHGAATPSAAPDAAAKEPAEAEAEPRRRLLVIVFEGLRQSALSAYLDRLDEADDEPDWPSGLALLRQEGFRFASARRAESSVPGGGLAAAATWATGQWPDTHRIPGDVFYEAHPDGRLLRYDFDDPLDRSRVYYGPALNWPSGEAPTLPAALLGAQTWAHRLAPTHRVAFSFAPFGHEAEWLVPEPADLGAATGLPTAYAAAATGLFDRESADSTLELLLRDDVDVVVAWFRGIASETCARSACDDDGDLPAVQARALQRLDGRLADVLTRYQIARPNAFARTSALVVGTGSGVDRDDAAADNAKIMPPETLLERIVEQASEPCVEVLQTAVARAELLAAAGASSVARLYVRPAPLGQQARVRRTVECLDPALDALLARSPWLAAGAWRSKAQMQRPGRRADRFVVRMREGFARGLSTRRRNQLIARIRRAIDDGPAPRAGDAMLFAASGWIFADPQAPRLMPEAALGGLSDVSMAIPLLVAARELSDVADGALRSTTVELADVAPTILAMAQAPAAAFEGLPRPPVMAWRDGRTLEHVRADRRIRRPTGPERPSISVVEGPDGLVAALEESAELWPADVVALRIGDAVHRWDPDANTFPEGVPCTYVEKDRRRHWRCTGQVDRRGPGTSLVAVQRDPSGDDDVDGPLTRITPVVLGASKPFLGDAEVQCTRADGLRIAIDARDPLGLSRATVHLVDDRIGGATRVPGSLSATVELGRIVPTAPCVADPFAPACAVEATATAVEGPVELPFSPQLMAHHAAARALPGARPVDRPALHARWSAAGEPGSAPANAWLALEVCNIAGQCVRRALISDVDLRDRPACP